MLCLDPTTIFELTDTNNCRNQMKKKKKKVHNVLTAPNKIAKQLLLRCLL